MYPMCIVINGGTHFSFKNSIDSNEYVFNAMDGLADIFNWGKGVGHLIVWALSLLSAYCSDLNYDWKGDCIKQLENIAETRLNTDGIHNILKNINNKAISPNN